MRFGDRLCALPSAPAVEGGDWGRWLPPSPGVGVGSSPPPWCPPWRLRTGCDLVHKARASGTKIEPEKCLESICRFQMSVVIAVTGKVGLVGLSYTKLAVQPAFIPDSPGAWAWWPFLGCSVPPPLPRALRPQSSPVHPNIFEPPFQIPGATGQPAVILQNFSRRILSSSAITAATDSQGRRGFLSCFRT